MSEHWLAALRAKMDSVGHERNDARWVAPAKAAEGAARGSNAPRIETNPTVQERGSEALKSGSGENAR